MAVSLVGDVESVRLAMRSSPANFRDYCAGHRQPPLSEFDRLVNLIITEQTKLITKNRERLAKIRAKRQP